MKAIPLTQGKFAIVDDNDYECLMIHKWCAVNNKYTFYAARHDKNKKMVRMHRLLMGAKESQEIDHINRNGLDNRRHNLRFCTHAQNMYNQGAMKGAVSKYKGVSPSGKKWTARVRDLGKTIYLGSFKTEVEAAMAYDEKAKELHKEFAFPNI